VLHTITEESEDIFSKKFGEISSNSMNIDERKSHEGANQPYFLGLGKNFL